jgi:hypothetical protein
VRSHKIVLCGPIIVSLASQSPLPNDFVASFPDFQCGHCCISIAAFPSGAVVSGRICRQFVTSRVDGDQRAETDMTLIFLASAGQN